MRASAPNLTECGAMISLTAQINRAQNRAEGYPTIMAKQRFIKSVITTAATDMPALPWTRGARRAAFIAKRKPMPSLSKTA